MQTLDIISVNLWQILASLGNLLLLFWIAKRFLYKPVRKMLDERAASIEGDYSAARAARVAAEEDKKAYAAHLQNAKSEAEGIIQTAVETAGARERELVEDAKKKADGIVRQAQIAAEQERRKAEESIKDEIVSVSSLLAEKMLSREVNAEDHKELIDDFIRTVDEVEDDAR